MTTPLTAWAQTNEGAMHRTQRSNLYELVVQRAARFPQAAALGGRDGLTWSVLDSTAVLEQVDRLALELTAEGVQASDRVVLWMPNLPRTVVYLFAVWKVGAIVVPLDRDVHPDTATRIVDSTEPRLILVGFPAEPGWGTSSRVLRWWEPGSQGGTGRLEPWEPPTEELAALFFTSGTTGAPKGCMISHANLLSQVAVMGQRIPLGTDSRLASILPLSHLFELTAGLLYPFAAGAGIYYVNSRRGSDVVDALDRQRVTHLIAVPQVAALLGQGVEKRVPRGLYAALSRVAEHVPFGLRRACFLPVHRALGGHLRLMAVGGAALAPETQVFWERLGVRMVQGYGASECSPVVACAAADGSTPLGSVGRPLPGVQVRLSDEGELEVRGPNVFRGYWRDEQRTSEVLRDGWYGTGDLAEIDARGNVRISGRARDLIVLPNGLNVWPEDVQQALAQAPEVRDAAVIGVPGPNGGMRLHAYLLPADAGQTPETGPLLARANGQLAAHQRVASASWWPGADFPRTSTLKVQRHLLPRPGEAPEPARESGVDGDEVTRTIGTLVGLASVPDAATLGDLGLDSLTLAELAARLEEQTGHPLDEALFRTDSTVAELRTRLASDAPAPTLASSRELDEGAVSQPTWPYTWGQSLRALAAPLDVLYGLVATRTAVLGGENLRGLPVEIVVAGTHHSYADLPRVRTALRRAGGRSRLRRLVVATAANQVRAAGMLGWFGRLAYGMLPLHQYRHQEASLREMVRLVHASRGTLLVFPQGRHVDPADERAGRATARFQPGVAYLAAALRAPVVPYGIAGTERVMPAHLETFRGLVVAGVPVSLRRAPLAIAFGAPLALEPGEDVHLFTRRLQEACFTLTRQAEAALLER